MNETKHHTNQSLQPGSPDFVSRRHFLQSASIFGMLAGATANAVAADDTGKDKPRTALNQPVAQDYVVVTQVPDKNHFIHDPALTILPNGHLIVAAPVWARGAHESSKKAEDKVVRVYRSTDGGKSWAQRCEKPWAESTLFPYQGKLYMFLQLKTFEGVWVTVSDDEGKTWADPVEVIKGAPDRKFWSLQVGMVVKDGWLYWANGRAYQDMGAVACDLSKGLMNPAAWRASDVVVMPIPKEVQSGTYEDGHTMRCLEGNVVEVGGRMLVLARAVINRYGTSNMGAMFDLTNGTDRLDLKFTQLVSIPGGQCKFHILHDAPSKLFWMASNLPSNSMDLIHALETYPSAYPKDWHSLREDRRILMLYYSLDAINWFPACCIAKAEKMNQSFMYPSMVIDGDDIALLSRTGRDSGDYHDADLATFHRVRNFRSLAMDIHPKL
jgi:hypothetical protein